MMPIEEDAMMPVEEGVVETLQRSGPCCLNDIVMYLPNYSWAELVVAVDRMWRDGRVVLRPLGYSTYQLALLSQFVDSSSPAGQLESSLIG